MTTPLPMRESATRACRSRLACTAALAALVLSGCNLLGDPKDQATIYSPNPQVQADPSWPAVAWSLTVSHPDSPRLVDNLRLVVRPSPGEVQIYKGASWAKPPPRQVEDTVLRILEDSGKIGAIGRQASGLNGSYKLLMDLRRYEADYAGNAVPSAVIEVNAKLLHAPRNDAVASRTFVRTVPATATDVGSVATAFSQALGQVSTDIAGWTLQTGEHHERSATHPKDR